MNKYTLLTLGMLFVLTSCSSTPVQPWEREILAQRKMQLEPYPNDAFLDAHVYFSKEASKGGAGVGGGGCGCN